MDDMCVGCIYMNKDGVCSKNEQIRIQALKDATTVLENNYSTRIKLLKEREEECLEVGDQETALRCRVAYHELERVIEDLHNLVRSK